MNEVGNKNYETRCWESILAIKVACFPFCVLLPSSLSLLSSYLSSFNHIFISSAYTGINGLWCWERFGLRCSTVIDHIQVTHAFSGFLWVDLAFVSGVLSPSYLLSKSWLSGQVSGLFLLYHNTTGPALHGTVLADFCFWGRDKLLTIKIFTFSSCHVSWVRVVSILSCFEFSLWIFKRNLISDFSRGKTSKHICCQKSSLCSCRLIQVVPGVALTWIAMASFWKDVSQWRIQNLCGGNREIPKSCGYILLWVLETDYMNTAI